MSSVRVTGNVMLHCSLPLLLPSLADARQMAQRCKGHYFNAAFLIAASYATTILFSRHHAAVRRHAFDTDYYAAAALFRRRVEMPPLRRHAIITIYFHEMPTMICLLLLSMLLDAMTRTYCRC